jgi:hypothetical protein
MTSFERVNLRIKSHKLWVLRFLAPAETSPAQVRGLLISLKEAFIVGGILAG